MGSAGVLNPWRTRFGRIAAKDGFNGRIARNAWWAMLGSGAGQLFTLLAYFAVARILSKEEFGALGAVQSTVGLFGFAAGLGLATTTTKFVAELRVTDPHRAGRIAKLSTVLAWGSGSLFALVLVAVAGYIARQVFDEPSLRLPLQLSSALLVGSAVDGVQTGTLMGMEAFRVRTLVMVAKGFLTCTFATVGAWFYSLEGAVVGISMAALGAVVLNRVALRVVSMETGLALQGRITFQALWEERAIVWSYSIPAMLGEAIILPAQWLTVTLLVRQPNGLEQMAVYSAANKIQNVFGVVLTPVGRIALPVLSSLRAAGAERDMKRFLRQHLLLNVSVSAALGLFFSVFSPAVMHAFGPGYVSGWPIIVVLSGASVLLYAARPIAYALQSSNHMWNLFGVTVVRGAVLVSSFAILFCGLGGLGIALATLVSAVVVLVCCVGLYHRTLPQGAASTERTDGNSDWTL